MTHQDKTNQTTSGNRDHRVGAQAAGQLSLNGKPSPYRLFWGDLHNHNAVGYAKGSLERSIELAREHLDFFAFTGHASWHDMPKMPGDRHLKWVNGFKVHSDHWPKTKQLIEEANDDDFAAFLGYEWHSSKFGDYCVIYPDGTGKLYLPDHVDKLLEHTHYEGALAIPHHVGYKEGWRGANWKHFRQQASPVAEIFSEHGCCVTDQSSFPMLRHSNGGRSTANLIDRQLQKGIRFGFVASTDDHLGYPGAYGEGVVGVWAENLSREGIFTAIENRRTYAVTGDRIALEVSLNERPMGSELEPVSDRQIDVRVEGQDGIAMVELIRNARVIQRHFPQDTAEIPATLPGTTKCRIQYGWGPWAALGLGRICDWEMDVRIEGGKFLKALPGFQSTPFDEQRRDKLKFLSDQHLHLQSPTTRVNAYGEDPTKTLILEMQGDANSVLTVDMKTPINKTWKAPLKTLQQDNIVEFTGVFTSESFIIGQLISPSEYQTKIRWEDRRPKPEGSDWYYVRVTQHNGHQAWSSPIWVG